MKDLRRWLANQWDRSLAMLLSLLGLLSILLGWLGVSSHVLPAEQIPYLASGGLLGIFLLGGAGTLWLSADMRDEWRKLDEVARELRTANELAIAAEAHGPRALPAEIGTEPADTRKAARTSRARAAEPRGSAAHQSA
jgi:hypothetical protein